MNINRQTDCYTGHLPSGLSGLRAHRGLPFGPHRSRFVQSVIRNAGRWPHGRPQVRLQQIWRRIAPGVRPTLPLLLGIIVSIGRTRAATPFGLLRQLRHRPPAPTFSGRLQISHGSHSVAPELAHLVHGVRRRSQSHPTSQQQRQNDRHGWRPSPPPRRRRRSRQVSGRQEQPRPRQAAHERLHGLVERPAPENGSGEPQDAQLGDLQAAGHGVEDLVRDWKATFYRRGQAAASPAHERAPRLQVQVCFCSISLLHFPAKITIFSAPYFLNDKKSVLVF